MASNFSPYNSQKNQLPQYAYYTPALARHPASQPYYYAQPVALPQSVHVGQMYPRSRSFNDLYTPYYARQVPASPYGLMFGQSPVAHGADQIPLARPPPGTPGNDVASDTQSAVEQPTLSHSASNWSISNHSASNQSVSNQSVSNQSVSGQSTSNQSITNQSPASETPPASSSSGSKPLRYRGRMTRSKSHSMLLAPIDGNNLPLVLNPSTNMPPPVNTPAAHPQSLTVGPQGRRMSSTSSIQRHKNYSASMSSTGGSSTPSIMSTADTDSLTTQTSLSSTSSVDDDARFQKGSHARRRSVVANVVPEGGDASVGKLVENVNEVNSSEVQKDAEIATSNQQNDSAKSGPEEDVSHQTPQEATSTTAEVSTSARDIEEAKKTEASNEEQSQSSSEVATKETAAAAAAAAAATAAATIATTSTVASKAPVTKLPLKPNQPQASEASQAREASVKPAKSAKEALPTKDLKSGDAQINQTINVETRKEDSAVEANSKDSPPLSRPKRATVAAPSKLMLPSDLQPRSYAQSNTTSASSDSLTPKHSRSASWYTGTSTPSPSSPSGSSAPGGVDSQLKPRTSSANSTPSTQGDSSVFLRRSYASRQRPGVHSLPPRRPESYYGVGQQTPRHHPLPRQPSSSSSLSVASDAASEAASTASTGESPPMAKLEAKSSATPSPHKVRSSRSFGSRLKGIFSKDKTNEQTADDSSETASITSTRSSKSTMSIRSSSSGFSLPSRFRRKKTAAAAGSEPIEIPSPPPPAMTSQAFRSAMPHFPTPVKPGNSLPVSPPSPTEPEASRPPSPALSSIGRQVASNLTAGDIYPGLLRPNEVDTIISSLERTGSFERKPSTSRRSKEEKVPDERVIIAPEPSVHSTGTHKPLKSAMKSRNSVDARPVQARHIAFAKNTLVYNTYSAADYNRTPEPLPYDLHDRRVIVQLYRELNDLKLSMPVHPSSKHHTQYLFDRETRLARTPPI